MDEVFKELFTRFMERAKDLHNIACAGYGPLEDCTEQPCRDDWAVIVKAASIIKANVEALHGGV